MASGPRYTVRFRRHRTGKTDYHKRLAMLKSGTVRLVIRKTNRYITVQLIKYNQKGDQILGSATSKQLIKLGWKHSTSNITAAYLTGLAVAKVSEKAKVKDVIIDLGRNTSTKGSVLYAALKGAADGGINISFDEKILPTEDRILGKHTKTKDLQKDLEAIKKKLGVNNG
jgi:large subunit ribosomal protein L18